MVDTRYQSMCRAIAECHAVDEIKALHDQALALEIYARQAQNFEAERKATEIRIRAERQAGELLHRMARATPSGNNQHVRKEDVSRDVTHPPRLDELGISRNQSSRWQQLADVPDETFEAVLADKSEPVSTTRIIEAHLPPVIIHRPLKPEQLAIQFLEYLYAFERHGYFERDMGAALAATTPTVRREILDLAARIGAFLVSTGARHDD
ncbi:hypothetical protein [Paraburkholderia adhaesiva]|uniref:hypothetical protein n=1 Tax=Paraburkholderia adhaesiva TaxID=2883244 RepID=UPI001F466EA2|nr:hypothetical protein [Paraburkholderia adhaesiva]